MHVNTVSENFRAIMGWSSRVIEDGFVDISWPR